MKLERYLAERKLTPSAFAVSIASPPSTITRLLRGERVPGLELLQRIYTATDGAVTANDFLVIRQATPKDAA